MGKRARSGSVGSASAKKRRRMGNRYYASRVYRPTYVRPGYGAIGRTPGGAVLGEMKYFDTELVNKTLPANNNWATATCDPATINNLCSPTVGPGYNQRIGKEIKILKLKIRGNFILPPQESVAPGFTPCVIRYGLFQDMQTNGTQATGNLVMTPTSTQLGLANTFQNIDNFGRFKVLKDKICTLQDPNLAGSATDHDTNGKICNFKISLKFKQPIIVRFNNTNGGGVADIIDNSLHFYANGTSSSAPVQLNYLCRVCYKE